MARHNRISFQVSPKFSDKMKDLQKRIRIKTGNNKSLRDITEEIISIPAFEEIEKELLDHDLRMDIRVKFDRRMY